MSFAGSWRIGWRTASWSDNIFAPAFRQTFQRKGRIGRTCGWAKHSRTSGERFAAASVEPESRTAVGNDGSLYAIERTNNTDETTLENLTSLLMFDMNKATTKAAVYDTLNTYFKEVQNYGIHYYAREN